jgi:hypothetical protein
VKKSAIVTQIGICVSITLFHTFLSPHKPAQAEEHKPFQVLSIYDDIPEIRISKDIEILPPLATTKATQENQSQVDNISKNLPKFTSENIETIKPNFSTKAADLLPVFVPNHNSEKLLTLESEEKNIEESTEKPKNTSTQNDSIYKNPPQVVPKKKVPTILTTFPINNLTVNHLTKEIVDGQLTFGDDRSTNVNFDAFYPVDNQVIQSLSKNNIFTSDFTGDYIQLRTLNRERQVSINQSIPQTMKGFETQQTFFGPCELIKKDVAEAEQQCTFLPPLIVDRNSIEPRFFIPTRIEQMGKIGDVISPETLAIIKQPGWQNLGAKGEFTGVDLYFPNIGATPGNSRSNQTSISRREDIDTTYKLGYYRVRQIVKANAQRAVIGRTIKGMGVIVDSDDLALYPVLGAVAEMLPDIDPNLEGLPQDANTNINKNLFNAANNIRVPENSFVIYQAGTGEAEHTKKATNNPLISKLTSGKNTSKKIPSASFNSIWVGVSPVTERSITQDSRYVSVGEEKQVTRAGGEGGIDSDISFTLATNDRTSQNSIASVDLNNFYIQAYISFLERDVNFVNTSKLTEKTNYYPHLTFSGNITNYNSVIRYYAGVITTKNPKFYLGGDYTRNWDNWLLNIGAIAYENGDRDYFSKTEGSLSKRFQLNKTANLGLFTEFRYAWERDKDNFLDNPTDNFVSVGANLDINRLSFRISQLLDVLPDAIGNKLQGSVTTALGNNGSLTAYLSPQRNINNYGISAKYNWLSSKTASSLILNWNRGIYDFGNDSLGKDLEINNNTFTLIFKTFFK